MSLSVGLAEPVFVITVKVAWFRGQSSTGRSHSTSQPTGISWSAVHSQLAMSSSICEATASGFTARKGALSKKSDYLAIARRRMPANPPPISGPSTGTIA